MADQWMLDDFYKKHGPCCAGCDHWRWFNSTYGECINSKIVPAEERTAMLEITSSTLAIGAGHVFTKRDYHCSQFRDTQGSE